MRTTLAYVLLLTGTLFVAPVTAQPKVAASAPCATAKDCLGQLQAISSGKAGKKEMAGLSFDGREETLAARAVFLGGKGAYAPLAKMLSTKDQIVATAVAAALGGAGPDAISVLPALARELTTRRKTARGTELNTAATWAVDAIDPARALPLLKAAAKKNFWVSLYYLYSERSSDFRDLLTSVDGAAAAEFLMDPNGGAEEVTELLELASKNPKLPAALKKKVAAALAENEAVTKKTPPQTALAKIEKLLANTEYPPGDRELRIPFLAIAAAGKASVPLIPRLIEWQKSKLTAARATWALGEIPDASSHAAVKAALGQRENWRLPLLAANALGRQGSGAADALDALRQVGAEHWHPAVKGMALAAIQAITGKGPAPESLDRLEWRGHTSRGEAWGESDELLGQGHRCKAPATWVKPKGEDQCQSPTELGKTVSCKYLATVAGGTARLALPDDSLFGFEREKKLPLEFVPQHHESPKSIVVLKQGFLRGVTGGGLRLGVVEIELGRENGDQIDGPGQVWLSILDKKGATWEVTSTVQLPAGLAGVAHLADGSLQLDFPNTQLLVRVSPDGRVTAGDCQPDPLVTHLPEASLLQTLLDDAGLTDRLEAAGVRLPLHVSYRYEPPAELDKVHFGGQSVILEKSKRLIKGGQTLHIVESKLEIQPSKEHWLRRLTGAVEMEVSFPALQIHQYFRLGLERGVWKILPPLPRPEDRPARPSVAVPADVKAPPRDALTTESGLSFKILKPAKDGYDSGETPAPANLVSVEITVWNSEGKQIFPVSGKAPAVAQLPLTMTMGGLTEALLMMKTSESRRIWIPARLAYPAPPAEAKDLVADVLLVSIAREEEEDLFPVEIEEMEKENKAPRDLQAPPASAKTTATGLKYRLLNTDKSKSKLVDKEDGESVSMTYKVWTKNGTLVDHGSLGEIGYGRESNQGAPFALVIRGLAEGLALMKPLQEFRLWIPAHLAHGDSPRVPNVPPGPLVVDVKLLAR